MKKKRGRSVLASERAMRPIGGGRGKSGKGEGEGPTASFYGLRISMGWGKRNGVDLSTVHNIQVGGRSKSPVGKAKRRTETFLWTGLGREDAWHYGGEGGGGNLRGEGGQFTGGGGGSIPFIPENRVSKKSFTHRQEGTVGEQNRRGRVSGLLGQIPSR